MKETEHGVDVRLIDLERLLALSENHLESLLLIEELLSDCVEHAEALEGKLQESKCSSAGVSVELLVIFYLKLDKVDVTFEFWTQVLLNCGVIMGVIRKCDVEEWAESIDIDTHGLAMRIHSK